MMLASNSYNHGTNALALHNCNKSVVCDPFLVPFRLNLVCTPRIQCASFLHFYRGLVFRSELGRQESDPSSVHNFYRCVHHGLLICKNYRTTARMFSSTSIIDDNYLQHAFLLSDKLRTIMQASCSVMLMLLVLMVSTLLLPISSRRLDNGVFRVPIPCNLCTIPPHAPLGELSCPVSNSAFPDTNFSVAHGFFRLPDQDLVLGSCVVSLESPKLRLGG